MRVSGSRVKILVGVDGAQTYRPVLSLLARMRFESSELTLAHAAPAPGGLAIFGYPEDASGLEPGRTAVQPGGEILEQAADAAARAGLQAETVLLSGRAAPALMEFATREGADLIAIHSVRKSALGSLFLGSVARGLAIGGEQSILISKGEVARSGPLKAVFATDHSPYAKAAMERLIALRPRGIAQLHLMSAATMNDYEPDAAHYDAVKEEGLTQEWLEHELERKNEAAAKELAEAGFQVTTTVDPGRPVEAIRRAMSSHSADLLIMGAQGHGFIHRLFIGSTSLQQVVAEPYSVLLLRP